MNITNYRWLYRNRNWNRKKSIRRRRGTRNMTVYQLNRDELVELKQRYYFQLHNKDISYDEQAFIDKLVTDEEIYEEYKNTIKNSPR